MAVNKIEFKFAELRNYPPDETNPKTHRFYRFPWPTSSTRPNLDLEYLCLESCILKPVPPDLGLSSLKTLSLGCVVLDQDDFNKIASACLKLECLTLDCCTLPQTFRIGGDGGTFDHLKSLALHILIYPRRGILIRKLIEIHDLLNLKNFESRGDGIDFSIRGIPSLERGCFFDHKLTADFMFHEFPEAAPHLEILSLTLFSNKVQLSQNITKFNSLKSLELEVYVVSDFNLISLANFLNAAPLLQKFHIEFVWWKNITKRILTTSAGHVHPHLKEVEISGFCNNKYQVELALYLLHKAIALERMTIILGREPDSGDEHDILNIKHVHDQFLKEIVELNRGVQLIVKPPIKIHLS
ncbi:hypothetical protein COLO4_38129 [Corchorus olitorius]|uniref:At1g61320/AtMIF1 LRR domain-containing protein n=1 Tax=Corchorus olitorius TaxID=93759 RepID=A0A1R3FWU5_9ROSI|nr:hypothetical protein COLO4_38129 [Corchorus olitorius]